jgi:hypothetical protein
MSASSPARSTDEAAPSSFFFCRLLPPRPSFALDMAPEEREIMQKHAAY